MLTYTRRCSMILIIRAVKIRTTMAYNYTFTEVTVIFKKKNLKKRTVLEKDDPDPEEHWVLFQKTLVQVSAPTYQLLLVSNSRSRESDILFWTQPAPDTHGIHVSKTLILRKINEYF